MLLAARAGGAERVAGDEHADDAQRVVGPVVAGHLAAARVQPDQVLGPPSIVGRPSNQCRCRSAGCSRRSRSAALVTS